MISCLSETCDKTVEVAVEITEFSITDRGFEPGGTHGIPPEPWIQRRAGGYVCSVKCRHDREEYDANMGNEEIYDANWSAYKGQPPHRVLAGLGADQLFSDKRPTLSGLLPVGELPSEYRYGKCSCGGVLERKNADWAMCPTCGDDTFPISDRAAGAECAPPMAYCLSGGQLTADQTANVTARLEAMNASGAWHTPIVECAIDIDALKYAARSIGGEHPRKPAKRSAAWVTVNSDAIHDLLDKIENL